MTRARTKLALVQKTEQPIDINAKMRAEILSRDWSLTWIEGDKAKAVEIADRRRWRFR